MKRQPNSGSDAWREKFHDSQAELRQKQSQWADTERLLRLLASRLTVVAVSSDQLLTNNLQVLHKALCGGENIVHLHKLIEDISARILLLENTEQKTDSNSPRFEASENREQLRLVCDVFIVLLDNINVPAQYTKRIDKIKTIMLRSDAKDLQQRMLASTMGLAEVLIDIFDSIEHDKQMLAHYLQQLTGELHGLDEGLTVSSVWPAKKQQAENDINQKVEIEIAEMENSMTSLVNVVEFKKSVQATLNTIRDHMQAYKQRELKRNQQANEVAVGLTRQIKEMEQQCTELKEQILEKHQQTLSDPLTGIRNRLAYEEAIKDEVDRFKRYARPVCLLILDLDNFKHINDTYGHNTGDKMLKFAAGILAKNIRSVDFLARYGGEEFAVILPELNLKEAKKTAQKICKAIDAGKFKDGSQMVHMTISGGIAQLRQGDTAESLFERADNALYLAKSKGRNCYETE